MILFTDLFSHNLYYLLFITTFLGQYLMKFKCFIHHMYKEVNGKSYGLSKAGLQLENGQWHIQELKDSQHSAYFHPTLF